MPKFHAWIALALFAASPGALSPAFAQDKQSGNLEETAEPELLTYEALSPKEKAAVDAWLEWSEEGIAGRIVTGEDGWDNMLDRLRMKAITAGNEFERQIYTRVVRDQFMRHTLPRTLADKRLKFESLGHPLTDEELVRVQEVMHHRAFDADLDNTAWLKQAFEDNGRKWWPISEIGEDASYYLWLLVQHADRDPAFQKTILMEMEPMAETGEVGKSHYAYLYDRVMSGAGEPQRYGTQMECREARYQPKLLENEDQVDAMRASVGLGPIADYVSLPRFDPAHCEASEDEDD